MKAPKTLTYVPIKLPPQFDNLEELQREIVLRIARSMMINNKRFMECKHTVRLWP